MNGIAKVMTVMAIVAMPALQAMAADDEPKLTVKPTGRVLMDGAVYLPDGDGLADGVALPDIRMGVKASYGKWSGKIDAGYSFNKLSMKDVYIQYSFNSENYLRAGYFVHQFGLNAATSSSMKPQMEAATTDTYFNATGRNIGLEYVHDCGPAFLSFSGIVAGTSMTSPSNEQGKVSVGALNRAVWRPVTPPDSWRRWACRSGISRLSTRLKLPKTERPSHQRATSTGRPDFPRVSARRECSEPMSPMQKECSNFRPNGCS